MKENLKTITLSVLCTLGVLSLMSVVKANESNPNPLPAYEMHKMEDAKIMIFNKYNGEVEYKELEGDFVAEEISHYFRNKIVSGSL